MANLRGKNIIVAAGKHGNLVAQVCQVQQGSRDTLELWWFDRDGNAFDLTGATITAAWTDGTDTYAVDGVLTPDADQTTNKGLFAWALGEGDTGTAGSHSLQFKAVIGGLPFYSYSALYEVLDSLDADAVAAGALVGISASQAAWVATGAAGGPLGTAAYQDIADLPFDDEGEAATVQGNLDSHTGDTSNPHGVTAAQVGADPAGSAALRVAKTGDTMSGALQFSGTDHAGLELNKLTTTQRNSLTPAIGMLIYNSTDSEYQRYDGTYWRDIATNEARPIYLLYDDFTTPASAPLTSPRTAEPGPGTGDIVDTGNRISIAALGELIFFSGGGTRTDPIIRYGAVTRVQNLCMKFRVRQNNTDTAVLIAPIGFTTATTGDIVGNRVRFTSGNIQAASGSYFGTYTTLTAYDVLTDYDIAIVLDVSGNVGRHYIKGGAFGEWTELDTVALNATTTLYPALSGYNRAVAFSDVRVAALPSGYTTADLDLLAQPIPTRESLLVQFPAQGYATITRSGNDYLMTHIMTNGAARWTLNARTSPTTIHDLEKCEWVPLSGTAVELLSGGVFEYAINADGGGFMGNGHGNDTQASLAIDVDGIDYSAMTDGQSYSGRQIVVTRVSTLDDTVNTATVTTTYTINENGLTYAASFNWTTGSNPGGWANMMPFQSALSSGRIGNGIHYNFSEYSPGVIENRTADSAVFWERGGNYASLITLDRRVPCNVLVANPNKFYSSGGVDNHSANIRLMKLDDTSDM